MGYNNNHVGMHMIWFRPRFYDYAYDRTIEEQWRMRLKKEKLASQKAEIKIEAPVVKEEEPVSNKNQNNKTMKQNNKTKKTHLMQSNDNEYGTEFIANGAFFVDADLVTQNIVFMALKNKKDLYRIFKEADEIMKKDARMNPSPDSNWYGYPLLNKAMIYMRIIADKLDCNYQEFFLDNSQIIKKYIYNLLDQISIDSWDGEFDKESGEAVISIESFDDKLLGRDINKQTLEARWAFKTMDLCLYKECDDGKPFYSVSYGSISVDTRNRNNNSVWGAYLLLEEEGKVKDLVEKLIEMNPDWGY